MTKTTTINVSIGFRQAQPTLDNQLTRLLHEILTLATTQKTRLTKTLAEKRFCQTNQDDNFGKPDFAKNGHYQRKRQSFTN